MVRERGIDNTDKGPLNASTSSSTGGATPNLNRRSYLKIAGTAAAAVAAASASASAATERHGITFDRVLDAVDDLGCDPNGGNSIQSRVRNAAANDTLIVFPEGTYRIDGNLSLTELRNFGIVGDGDVTWEIPRDTHIWAVNYDYMRNALFEGIHIDQTRPWANGRTRFGCSGGKIHVEDVHVDGNTPPVSGETKFRLLPFARSTDARVIVKEFRAPDGGYPGTYIQGGGGVYIGGANRGLVRLIDCHFEGFPNNGAYVSRTPGDVQIVGGLYKNNDVSQIRFSGPNSYADGVTCVIDHNDWGDDKLGSSSEGNNTRLVWIDAKDFDKNGGELRNCTLRATRWDGDPVPGGLVINGNHGAFTVRDTEIEMDINRPAVRADPPRTDSWAPPTPHHLRVYDTHITGAAGGGSTVRIRNRPGSRVERTCIHQSGGNRDGIRIENSNNCRVADTNVDVTGRALVFRNSNVETSNVTQDSECDYESDANPDSEEGSDTDDGGDSGNDDGSGSESDLEYTLTIEGVTGDWVGYEFSVSGDLEKSTAMGASIDSNDVVDGNTAAGYVVDGRDSYGFDGDVTAFEADDDVQLYLDGEETTVDELPGQTQDDDSGSEESDESDGSGESTAHTVTIEGVTGDWVDYEFAADGAVEKSTAMGASIDSNDDIHNDGTVSGAVVDGRDSYELDGDVTAFEAGDDVQLYLDGEETTAEELVADGTDDDGDEATDHTVTIEGVTGDWVGYEFEVDADLEKSTAMGASINGNDDLDGNTAAGYVVDGRDSYSYTGGVGSFSAEDDVQLYLDGEEITAEELLAGERDSTRTVTFDGTDVPERVTYELAVSGDLEKSTAMGASINGNDDLDGNAASGIINGGRDSYSFTGEITELAVDGDIRVYINGEEIDTDGLESDGGDLPNTLAFDGRHLDSASTYRVRVSGELVVDDSVTTGEAGQVDARTAEGSVRGDVDGYRFSGDVISLAIDGDAAVVFEDNDG